MSNLTLYQILIAVGLIASFLIAIELGFRLGRSRVRGSDASKAIETGAIQGAMLGLLGLLLGFCFAGAASRFIERQDLIVAEANAISTAFLRADLIDEPHAGQLRSALADYVDHRLGLANRIAFGFQPQDIEAVAALHARIWNAASAGALARPAAMLAVVGPVNEVIDLHATRISAGRKHLPAVVLGLLYACSVLTLAVIGYSCGLARRRSLTLTSVIAVLVAASLWVTMDLDYSRIGLIRASDAPLAELKLRPPGDPISGPPGQSSSHREQSMRRTTEPPKGASWVEVPCAG